MSKFMHSLFGFLICVGMPQPAFPQFTETFRGTGEFDSVSGDVSGLDNPGWVFRGDGEISDAGYVVKNGVSHPNFPNFDNIFTELGYFGSFSTSVEIDDLVLGTSVLPDLIDHQSTLLWNVLLDRDDNVGRILFRLQELDDDAAYWGLRVHAGTQTTGTRVPAGEDVLLKVQYDEDTSLVSFQYFPDSSLDTHVALGPLSYDRQIAGAMLTELVFLSRFTGQADGIVTEWKMQYPEDHGDFDGDGVLTISDIDLLQQAIRIGEIEFDLNNSGSTNHDDLELWVHDLKSTFFGDANLDGEFNSGDLVQVFEAGQYEDAIDGNSTWVNGDWNSDGDFTSRDLVFAFADGGYERGPRQAVQTVPEPHGMLPFFALCLLQFFRRSFLLWS